MPANHHKQLFPGPNDERRVLGRLLPIPQPGHSGKNREYCSRLALLGASLIAAIRLGQSTKPNAANLWEIGSPLPIPKSCIALTGYKVR